MVDNGAIGSSIESGTTYLYHKNGNVRSTHSSIIFPLITTNNIIGLVIVVLDDIPEKVSPALNRLAHIFSGMYAANLYSVMLLQELDHTKSLLEQKVAARTMSLTQSRRELQLIVDSVQAGIFVVDTETNSIVNTNYIAEFLCGCRQEQLIGQDASKFFLSTDNKAEVFDNNVKFSRNFESIFVNLKGEQIPILRTFSIITIGDQRVRLESFFDITERKKAELALRKHNEELDLKVQERTEELQLLVHKLKDEVSERYRAELEIRKMLEKEQELNELKSRFVSMVSHEFRTPLTIISSSAQILHRYIDRLTFENKKENLLRILKTVDYMKDLLENVLFIGKTDSQNVSFSPKIVDVNALCKSIIDEYLMSIETKREIACSYSITKNMINIDENLLRHILINLLSNATKYSDNNSIVEFSVEQSETDTIFSICDHGIGIPEDEQEQIFDVFHRARNVGTISGTGLGMAIVMRSVDMHSGHIELSSKVGQGTSFRVFLPIKQIEE
jgi:PAS domain S-box-containing protein